MTSKWSKLATVAVFLVTAPLAAQGGPREVPTPPAVAFMTIAAPPPGLAAPTEHEAALGPSVRKLTVGVRPNADGPTSVASPVVAATHHSAALMLVGGAALIAGALVGGDAGTVIMVGGAVIGLVGLWNYLK